VIALAYRLFQKLHNRLVMENTNDLQTFWELTVKNEVPPNMILTISSTDIEGYLLSVTDKAYFGNHF
jgi:hypothetical protein